MSKEYFESIGCYGVVLFGFKVKDEVWKYLYLLLYSAISYLHLY